MLVAEDASAHHLFAPQAEAINSLLCGGETEAWEVTWPRRSWAVMEKVGGEGRGPGRSLGPWGGGALP